jgi:hypothetical protein
MESRCPPFTSCWVSSTRISRRIGPVDPFDIFRGVHMIPAFAHWHGTIDELGKSVARRPADDDEDCSTTMLECKIFFFYIHGCRLGAHDFLDLLTAIRSCDSESAAEVWDTGQLVNAPNPCLMRQTQQSTKT